VHMICYYDLICSQQQLWIDGLDVSCSLLQCQG
jgi:hypothetical protein